MADVETQMEEIKEEKVSEAKEKPETENSDDSDKINQGNAESSEIDPFHYLKSDEFTSEKFKIEICNLPNKFGFNQLKKRLNGSLGLKIHKIKNPGMNVAFVTFKCEEDRVDAIKKINEHVWKGNKLTAKIAKPSADPLFKKRKQEAMLNSPSEKKMKTENSDIPPEIRIKNSVTPYWNLDYSQQLKKKSEDIEEVLTSIARRFDIKQLFVEERKKYNGMCCELLPIIPSPVLEKYRNKCEFSISKNIDGKENCVGFRYGLYKDGFSTVGDPSDVNFLSDAAKSVAKSFEEFLSTSPYKSFHQGTHEGHWRQLTVRTTRSGDVMIIPEFFIKNVTQEELDLEKKRLVEYFKTGDGSKLKITSMYFTPLKVGEGQNNKVYEHLLGEKTITEKMLDMTFQISPDAFFQVNTSGAEVLYNTIGDWCNLDADKKTTVLDICCGTGTIGLALAKRVTKVIGVEMCQQAVDDAKQNAKINDINNVTYYCSKAEDAMGSIMRSIWTPNVVAIVDPPRAGLHRSVLKSLRTCRRLKRLIYVSCSAQSAKDNFIDLIRPPTKKLKGVPYKLIKAVPVDLFPMTSHCELILLFERESVRESDSDSDFGQSTKTAKSTETSQNTGTVEQSASVQKSETETKTVENTDKSNSETMEVQESGKMADDVSTQINNDK